MSIETPADLAGIQHAGRITAETLDALERHVKVGVTTAELDAVAAAVFAKQGARSAPALVYGFPGTVLISINDEIVHGIPGPRRIARGDHISTMPARWSRSRKRSSSIVPAAMRQFGSCMKTNTTGRGVAIPICSVFWKSPSGLSRAENLDFLLS